MKNQPQIQSFYLYRVPHADDLILVFNPLCKMVLEKKGDLHSMEITQKQALISLSLSHGLLLPLLACCCCRLVAAAATPLLATKLPLMAPPPLATLR